MKKTLRLFICAVITAVLILLVRFVSDSQLFSPAEPTVFEVGAYTDYYYTRLNENEKQAYTAVREKIESFPAEIEIPELDSASLSKVLTALINDSPQLFMLDSCTLMSRNYRHYFVPDYKMDINTFLQKKAAIEQKTADIIATMPDTLVPEEKELYLHDYIINCCSYSETDSYSESTVEGVFLDGKAKCSGYAKAFKLLLNAAGIDSVLISGTATDYSGKSSNHMWNAVRLYDSWYYTDITWDDPISDNGENICRHVFFNMNDQMLKQTHSDFSFEHECTDSSLYYYQMIDSYYNYYNYNTLLSIGANIVEAAESSENQVQIMFSDKETYRAACSGLFDGEEIYQALKEANRKTDKKIITNAVSYRLDENALLITVIFETR